MDRQRKKAAPLNRRGHARSGPAERGLGDAASRLLRGAAGSRGNQALAARMQAANAARDELLAFATRRLRAMLDIQLREADLLDRRNEWMRKVFKGADTLPEPTRWCEVARAWRKAVLALCAGRLGRGRQLAERAMELEDAALRALPHSVRREGPLPPSPAAEAPPAADDVTPSATCATCRAPEALALASRIEAEESHAARVGRKGKHPHHWWSDEEEDGDGDDGADGEQP